MSRLLGPLFLGLRPPGRSWAVSGALWRLRQGADQGRWGGPADLRSGRGQRLAPVQLLP